MDSDDAIIFFELTRGKAEFAKAHFSITEKKIKYSQKDVAHYSVQYSLSEIKGA